MTLPLRHRGPDDEGTWIDPDAGIAMGHRRLSIIDLSPGGHQPMLCSCGRYCVSFNGEIYNYRELRTRLEALGIAFRSSSDTEVLLECVCRWGLDAALREFNGMFGFALWDRRERVLTLVRDRLGEKPLYYGRFDRFLLFGSELKALQAYPGFSANVDRGALRLYLRHGYIASPHTIYEGVHKLAPGSIVRFFTQRSKDEPRQERYWNPVIQGDHRQALLTAADVAEELDRLLDDSMRLRLRSDVPVGAFLSGGVDSSLVVAKAQRFTSRPIKTFTIGYHEDAFSEHLHARLIANHLGTDHAELIVGSEDAMRVAPMMPTLYDEPFADPSQIPTFLVAQFARAQVTVSLSGDGGDELFGGYSDYHNGAQAWAINRMLQSMQIRSAVASMLRPSSTPRGWAAEHLGSVLPSSWRAWNVYERRLRWAELLSSDSIESIYRGIVSQRGAPMDLVPDHEEPETAFTSAAPLRAGSPLECMSYVDTLMYLPDDVLTKLDRATMAVGLEGRVPLLDHHLVEFARRIPDQFKSDGLRTKLILREVLGRSVPAELISRPKMGFTLPLAAWLRSDLRDWAEELLDERRLENEGFFNPRAVRRRWEQHLSGLYDWKDCLWSVLMFQGWLEVKHSDGRDVHVTQLCRA
jgi:asparagine synthase (glutamine-hydrolysing)